MSYGMVSVTCKPLYRYRLLFENCGVHRAISSKQLLDEVI